MPRFVFMLCCITVLHLSVRAQNLVPNPSFELHDYCPYDTATIFQVSNTFIADWHAATDGSPDYFNVCDGLTFDSMVYIPFNMYTENQPTHSGNAYVGLTIISDQASHREYIQVQLTDSLVAGEFYYFEAWLATAMRQLDIFWETTKFFTSDDIGVYFSKNRITDFAESDTLGVDAHLSNLDGNYILNPGTWNQMNGYYLATGGEKWMTIGNFKPDETTDTLFLPDEYCPCIEHWKSYFFIDDVSLTHAPQHFLQDTMICENDTLVLDINLGEGNYLWSTGETGKTIHITDAGLYWLQYDNGFQIVADSTYVSEHVDSVFTSAMDTSICNDELPITLYSPAVYETYLWSNGYTTASAEIFENGTTILTSRLKCNTYIDSFNVIAPPLPPDSILFFDFNDIVFCATNEPITLTAPANMEHYLWSTGDTTQSVSILQPGSYSVHYSVPCYDFFDYVTIYEDAYKDAVIDLGDSIDLCETGNYTAVLNAGVLSNYLWNTGATTQEIIIQDTGRYYVTSTTLCKILSDTVVVTDCRLLTDALILYPNPSFGVVQIESENELYLPEAHLEMLSFQGIVWETNFDFHNLIILDFSKFAKGYYLLRMISGEKVYYFDLVLQ